MILWVGTESSSNQLFEIVLIITDDNFELRTITPTYIIKRNIDKLVDTQDYELYSKNGLLDACDIGFYKTIDVEELLISKLPKKLSDFKIVFFTATEQLRVNKFMPDLRSILMEIPAYFNTETHAKVKSDEYLKVGRALEDTISYIGRTKRALSNK